MTSCNTCKQAYDEADPAAVKTHTNPIDCSRCRRCNGAPRCYMCTATSCMCSAH